MSVGRSTFYVDPPSQRHSMFVDHSEVRDLGGEMRDLSSASSTTTLPSVAGSVDRLTGLEEKKVKKKRTFFTLKPSKSSFSLRPFFSTTSLASKEVSTPRRRDSSSQTTDERAFGEVGVQTQNASTVDVPVQTSLSGEWDDRNSYGHRMRTFPSSLSSSPSYSLFHRPAQFPRGPSGDHFSGQSKAAAPTASETRAEGTALTNDRVVAPLDSRKVLKYATPGDSATAGATSEKAVTADSADVSQIECSATISSAPAANYFSANEVKSCGSPNFGKTPETAPCQASDNSQPSQVISSISSPDAHSSKSDSISNPFVTSGTSGKKSDPGPQVSAKLVPASLPVDKPSALKIERTDSPVKHSAKIKTVHFDLDDSDSSELNPETKDGSSINIKKDFEPACLNDSQRQRNLDKDFEDLLRNLDILVEHPIDTSENLSDLKISFNSFQSSPPKQTLLSSKLRSAFDVLHQEVLPPILETYENCEVEPSVEEKLNETPNTEIESSEHISKINPPNELLENSKENKLPSPTTELRKVEKNPNISKDDSTASSNVFASSTSDQLEANDGNRENVYESGIREYVIKTVSLPTLPSFFDSAPKSDSCSREETLSRISSAEQPNLEGVAERMVSRSSSRGSNPRSDFGDFMFAAKKFDSCENLDQLEEEIIRSLCEPDSNDRSEVFLPADSPDAARMRRVLLDRLLSGESEETGGGGSSSSSRVFAPEDIIEVPESRINARRTHKHVATVTKFDPLPNESDPEFPKQMTSTHSAANTLPTKNRDSSSIVDNIDSPHKNSVFYFPERKTLSSEVPQLSPASLTKTSKGVYSPGSLTETRLYEPEIRSRDSTAEKYVSGDAGSGACDFTHCLRPSEIHSSPFLDKISSRSSPEKSPLRSVAPVTAEMTEAKISDPNNAQCDFANCLKPSQVRNSVFRAELSDITAGKSDGGHSNRANNLSKSRTDGSPLAIQSLSTTDGNARESPVGEASHTSKMTIVLQTPYGGDETSGKQKVGDTNPSNGDETVEVSPVYSTKKEPKSEKPFLNSENPPPASLRTTVQQSLVLASPPPPPPPPPPPSSASKQKFVENNNACKNSLETVLQNPQSNLLRAALPAEPGCAPSKSPVMMELEKRFETTRRRHSCDELDQRVTGGQTPVHTRPCVSDVGSHASPENRSGSNGNSFEFHSPPTATTYQCNGSAPREQHSGSRNGVGTGERLRSPARTIVTDAPPPPGAVLVDQKVTVDGDRVHTDRFFALPVSEVLRETTTTARFVPAPPKYEGIGPTEDGVPLAPRNSVKKENMHNWYKTMFKSLHKADSSNDNQEYIIGYSSEPETSKKERTARKKSSTLDHRSGSNNSAKTIDHLQPYQPPSAKASLNVYSVRPRLIEDYEPGHSSVTDDEITVGYKRYLPALNTPKPSYEYKNGYEQESNFVRNLSPFDDGPDPEQQRVWYKEVQKGGGVPHFGLGKVAPEKPKDPVIGPLPPPPTHYDVVSHQATRPLTLPASYQTDNGLCQQSNGPYEMHMRQVIHTELQHRISPASSQLSSPSIPKSPSRSPDLKMAARALFDFRAESPKEIPLKKDDAVLILRQLDKNWYEGERQGRIGIFPVNYVEIVPPEHATTPIQSYTRGSGRVLYDFTAHTSLELSVRKGELVSLVRRVDANWYEARCGGGRKGIVPASYLQVMQEPPAEKRTPSPRLCLRSPRSSSPSKAASLSPSILQPVSTTPSKIDSGRGKSQSRAKKSSNLIEPVMYRALYSYSPLNSDELELSEGDVVCVVEMCDDGWFVGTSARTGVFGIFPGNYVERAP